MQVNPRLRFFIMIDGSGRIVPSSGIWRINQPKTGRWVEYTANVCCTTTTTATP